LGEVLYMTGAQLRVGRQNAGLTQQQAALVLGVSQPYLSQLETGYREIPTNLARKVTSVYRLSPTNLPLPGRDRLLLSADEIEQQLVALGYPRFPRRLVRGRSNPAELILGSLLNSDLDVRLVEALPWVLLTHADLDWTWLIDRCKLANLQNRLGYLVQLARELAKDLLVLGRLSEAHNELERSRLAVEGTLCHESMPQAERRWLRTHRPAVARYWNLLTDLTIKDLDYAA
jgi:transcriptional regulator with XRE-family HTH domain